MKVTWGKREGECVAWKAHAGDDRPSIGKCPEGTKPELSFDLGGDKALKEHFWGEMPPGLAEIGPRMGERLSDDRAKHHTVVKADGIKFHDADADDPAWIVKRGFELMFAAASESEVGAQNLWQKGDSLGMRGYPGFGRHMPKNWFKVWKSAIPMMWAPKTSWFKPKGELGWEIFTTALGLVREKRSKMLLKIVVALLGESMAGWRPKTQKTGGLPNVTWEPRKPVPMGTQIRNGAEAFTGALVSLDIAQDVEIQRAKEHYGDESHLPSKVPINAASSEVLRQAKMIWPGAPEDRDEGDSARLLSGDAWFGSALSCVELKRRLDVDSGFVVKSGTHLFPKKTLLNVLKARHGNHLAGSWVVMSAEIAGVELLAIAYAWPKKGVSFFVTTVGSTAAAAEPCVSHFEDESGEVWSKGIARPDIVPKIFELLPIIDSHNHERQSSLALEKCWPTQGPWFRLLATLSGMCLVDFKRVCAKLDPGKHGEMTTKRLAYVLVGRLVPWLKRKAGEDAQLSNRSPKRHAGKNRKTGATKQAWCFVCRKYYKTPHWAGKKCAACNEPICGPDRRKTGARRAMTCTHEHFNSLGPKIRCPGKPTSRSFPPTARGSWDKPSAADKPAEHID